MTFEQHVQNLLGEMSMKVAAQAAEIDALKAELEALQGAKKPAAGKGTKDPKA